MFICTLVLCSGFAADPVIYIPDETIYAPENSGTQIRATVYSSDLNSLTVLWYHESTLIDTISDPRYSVSAEGMNLHILNIARVELAVLGRYMAVVTAGNMNRTDVVQLAFPGKLQNKKNPKCIGTNCRG